jgi:enoyl-CoA hydratase/carnithine racemase
MAPAVLRTDQDGIRTLALNRPEVRNAIGLETLEALLAELGEVRGSDARVLVLTGSGTAFSAGGDIAQMLDRQGKAMETAERLRTGLAQVVEGLRALDQPVLAKVNGDCIGAGLGLALASDIVYASATARFGAPFVGLGLVPDTGLTHTLPRRIGLQRAKELVFTGALLQATEAWEMGLINKVVPPPDLDDEVRTLATRLSAMPLRTLGLAKRALQHGSEAPLGDAMAFEAYQQGIAFTTPEHAQGVQAFLARRKG